MPRIFKFPLELSKSESFQDCALVTVQMPSEAKILTVKTQDNTPCLWAEVEPLEDSYPREFLLIGTGYDVPEDVETKYLDTVAIHNERVVLHIYEKI